MLVNVPNMSLVFCHIFKCLLLHKLNLTLLKPGILRPTLYHPDPSPPSTPWHSLNTPLQPKQMLVQATPYHLHVQFFRMQSVLHPYLAIFNSSGGITCLVILIAIISRSVSWQLHYKRSSALSRRESYIW